ncbi:Mas-related G-protein coupled receptor member H [Fukomys damarensis]|uniref:Mas-related G-protein coupled receptor member H n=1 Tax=Fukomys damarensis TaxID=885580 RepID=A0A091E712_FUKDA|nr:Mas-related G-protein coupled receptor member H [Fukomys damarensis]
MKSPRIPTCCMHPGWEDHLHSWGISLLGLGANGLVLSLLLFSIGWHRFSVFLLHLALADFIFLACLVLEFTQQILQYFRDIKFHLPYVEAFLGASYTVGLRLLTFISVSRGRPVFFPIQYRLHSPKIQCSSRVRPPRMLYIILGLTLVSLWTSAFSDVQYFLPRNPIIPYYVELRALLSSVNSSVNPLA